MKPIDYCIIDGCMKPSKARGWCAAHWARWRSTGDPLGSVPRPSSLELFMRKVRTSKPDDCWIWVGSLNNQGYGWCRRTKEGVLLAHRLSYELFRGEIPEGMFVLHRCDTPAHLFLGTAKDNARDMVSKGRHKPSFWHSIHQYDVEEIRDRFKFGETNQSALAREYGINPSTVSRIVNNKSRLISYEK